MAATAATTPKMEGRPAPTAIRINEEEEDDDDDMHVFRRSGSPADPSEPEPVVPVLPTSGAPTAMSTAADDEDGGATPRKTANLRGSHVRDSLDIANPPAAYVERKCLGDKSELGKSNATERTVDTAETGASTDDDNDDDDDDEFEAEPKSLPLGQDAPESSITTTTTATTTTTTHVLLQRQPAKSAMKHRTLEDSLSAPYESARRRMARERRAEARRARKKLARDRSKRGDGSRRRRGLHKALSRMTLASRRNLFDPAAAAGAADGTAADGGHASAPATRYGPPPPGSRRGSMASERSGLSKSRSCSMDLLSSSASEHQECEEEHRDGVPEMAPLRAGGGGGIGNGIGNGIGIGNGRIDRRASDGADAAAAATGGSNARPSPASAAPDFHGRSMRSMSVRSMRNLLSTSKTKLLLGTSLSSLFSHGSKSERFTVDDDDDEGDDDELFPTLLAFDTVEIREYDPEVDANPSTSRGPGITLGWTYTASPPVDFYRYEEHRPPRRRMKEMRLPREVREERLMASGVSRSEMERSIKQANLAKRRRSKTLRQLRHYTLHERWEGMKRKCLKMVGRRKSHKEEERRLWEEAQYYFG